MSSIAFNPSAGTSSVIKPASAPTTTSTTSSSSSSTSIGQTFLNLLVQELQNQDPTDPMDSTAMVGQMISLNQLDQLISINQAVGGSSTSVTGTARNASANAALASPQASTAAAAAPSNALPFDPATMLPVGFASNQAIQSALDTSLASSKAAPLVKSLTTPMLGLN